MTCAHGGVLDQLCHPCHNSLGSANGMYKLNHCNLVKTHTSRIKREYNRRTTFPIISKILIIREAYNNTGNQASI